MTTIIAVLRKFIERNPWIRLKEKDLVNLGLGVEAVCSLFAWSAWVKWCKRREEKSVEAETEEEKKDETGDNPAGVELSNLGPASHHSTSRAVTETKDDASGVNTRAASEAMFQLELQAAVHRSVDRGSMSPNPINSMTLAAQRRAGGCYALSGVLDRPDKLRAARALGGRGSPVHTPGGFESPLMALNVATPILLVYLSRSTPPPRL